MKYAILLAYDGTGYRGWQTQKNGISVQSVLERAAHAAFGQKVNIVASGRTDSGVHAAGQVCHFSADISVPAEKVADALNFRLPPDISVLASAAAPEWFDSNRSAKRKTYRYSLYFSPRRNPLLDRYATRVDAPCDEGALSGAAELFTGVHDFAAYCSSGSQVKTTVREIYGISLSRREGLLDIYVCGGGFLYNMVRTMVGTMLWHSLGKLSLEDISASLREGRRSLVGKTMPAKGLTLVRVEYSPDPFEAVR